MIQRKYGLRDLTPERYNCWPLPGCPAIYEAVELTPISLRCGIGPCPGIYEQDAENYFIIGKIISKESAKQIPIGEGKTLADRIGQDEMLVSVPKGIIDGMKKSGDRNEE